MFTPILYSMGGIYLDTDVFVRRLFDDLLNNDMFVGFIFYNALGTAVIGARKGSPFIKRLLDSYNHLDTPTVNNNLLTNELKECFPNVTLDGRKQFLKDVTYGTAAVFKKQEFENGYIFKRGHTVHLSAGSWWRKDTNQYNKIKVIMTKVPVIHVISILKLIISIRQTWRIRRGQ